MANYTIKKEGKIFKKDFEYSEVTDDLDNLQNEDFNISTIRQITLWKLDRYVSLDKKVIKKINNLKSLTEFDEKKTRNVLKDLLDCEGVGLPMASTYLRFRNPHVFQIIDARAYRAAFDYEVNEVLSSSEKQSLIDANKIFTYRGGFYTALIAFLPISIFATYAKNRCYRTK